VVLAASGGQQPVSASGQGGFGSTNGGTGVPGMTYPQYMAQQLVQPYLGPVGKGGDAFKGGTGGLGGWNQGGQNGNSPGGGGGGGTMAVGTNGASGGAVIEFL